MIAPDFDRAVSETRGPSDPAEPSGLRALEISTLQVNVGLTCNLECRHCHVVSSPRRKEQMDWQTMEAILRVVREIGVETVDITGGAPEMNPHFREFVAALSDLDVHVLVRTNLTILLEPGYEDLPEFFRDRGVELIASLPCYLEENVDHQRGLGVYRESVAALKLLNELGYGSQENLLLRLVYNPIGPHLPPDQGRLELDYRRELHDRYGLQFTGLYTITNMPIGQFFADLRRSEKQDSYLALLAESFNPDTVENLMCRRQISIDWNGRLYDCDFNLALRMPVEASLPRTIHEFSREALWNRTIVTGKHCFGCTAGAGSSCGGVLAD